MMKFLTSHPFSDLRLEEMRQRERRPLTRWFVCVPGRSEQTRNWVARLKSQWFLVLLMLATGAKASDLFLDCRCFVICWNEWHELNLVHWLIQTSKYKPQTSSIHYPLTPGRLANKKPRCCRRFSRVRAGAGWQGQPSLKKLGVEAELHGVMCISDMTNDGTKHFWFVSFQWYVDDVDEILEPIKSVDLEKTTGNWKPVTRIYGVLKATLSKRQVSSTFFKVKAFPVWINMVEASSLFLSLQGK